MSENPEITDGRLVPVARGVKAYREPPIGGESFDAQHWHGRMATVLMMNGETLWLSTYELDQAPAEPGIYAWYCVPVAGEADLRADSDGSNDLGSGRFARFLASHTARLRHPAFHISAKGHLWAKWEGTIDEIGSRRLSQQIHRLGDEDRKGPGAKLGWAMETERTRRVLATVLLKCAPRLTSPIYIGVAANLQERLGKHVGDIRAATAEKAYGMPIQSKLRNTLGSRIVEVGFVEDDLRVGVLPLPNLDDDLDPAALRDIAEAAEFVLNRWHHPLLGIR